MKRGCRGNGFILAEALVVLSLLAGLLSIAIPAFQGSRDRAAESACRSTRASVGQAVTMYVAEHPESLLKSLSQVADAGYMDATPACPGRGVLMLIPAEDPGEVPQVGCSVHHWPEAEGTLADVAETKPLTTLGSTLTEIVGGMIARSLDYYRDNGRYPRSWGDYAFTDISLDPEEWKSAYNGIVYSPGGSRVKLTPEEGRAFKVNGMDGTERILKSSYNWSLWYSMETEKWYYQSVRSGNEIDISTLRVE